MSEKCLIFSLGVCNCNPEVTSDDVANNIFTIIKAAVNSGAKVLLSLTINCTQDENGRDFSKNVISSLERLILENGIGENVFLDKEYLDKPMGAENSDMYNRAKTSRKVEEILTKNPDAKVACIYKVDQDDRLSQDMIADAINILDNDDTKNLSLVYPVSFMFRNKSKKEFVITSINNDVITISNVETKEFYEITRTNEKTFLSKPENKDFDNDFLNLLFSKKYLASTIKNPLNHNYGQFRIDIINNISDFISKKKISFIDQNSLYKFSEECYDILKINEKPLPLLVDWIYKISPFETIERNIENKNLMLMSAGSTMSKEDKCLKENIIARRSLSVIYMFLYNKIVNDKNMTNFDDKIKALVSTVLPAKADDKYPEDLVINLFFNYIDASIDVLKKYPTIPFFCFMKGEELTQKHKNELLENFKLYISSFRETNVIKNMSKERQIEYLHV